MLDQHGQDLSYHPPRRPDAVVYPESAEEVAVVLRFAVERGIPVTPFGAGTSLEGHVIPTRGGISLDLTRLGRISSVDTANLTATAQAGVTREQLNARVNGDGLFFPVDPGADATLGGMAATNASGTTTVRYGGMRANTLALEAVLADGTIVRPGSRTLKTSAGYDLKSLLIGSEGTLAVITELTLRLHGIPERTIALRAAFPELGAACGAATAVAASGVGVSRLELIDAGTMHAVNAYKATGYDEAPSLFVEVAGTDSGVEGDREATEEILAAEGASSVTVEREAEGRNRLWEARHHVLFALVHASPGKLHRSTDVCVPVSALPDAIAHARGLADALGLDAAIIAHAGDGNYHVLFMLDPDDRAESEAARRLSDEIVGWALARGGTCTGEHGIGMGKTGYLAQEHGDLLPLMRAIKRAFDPNGILNPGKIL